jgi:hypothetical protein|tara:strand:+ start:5624 stop:5929 length:306 start_codon:yes stop_codon:yes gene_type:complete
MLKEKWPKALLLLIFIDLMATSIWFLFFGVEEANPILSQYLERSVLEFTIIKLALSLPGLWILSKHYDRILAKLGLLFLTVAYLGVMIIHYLLFLRLIIGI